MSFDVPDGLAHTSVNRLFARRDGTLHVAGSVGGFVSRIQGDGFTGTRPLLPPAIADRLRRTPTTLLQDRAGEADLGGGILPVLGHRSDRGAGPLVPRRPLWGRGRVDLG